jgi:hypothetical protein
MCGFLPAFDCRLGIEAMENPDAGPELMMDLYGFDLKATVQQQAVRMQADGISRRNEGM